MACGKSIISDVSDDKSIPWETIIQIIEVYRMTNQLDQSWVKEIFTPEELKQYVAFEAELKSNATPEQQEAFEKSCKNLGVSSLDGYYFHRFQDFKNFSEFDCVDELKRTGRLKKFAVSLYTLEELEIAVNSKEVDLIQLPFNVFDRSPEKIELFKKLIYIRSAFLQGLFFRDVETLPEKLLPLKDALIELHRLVKNYHVSMEDLCLKFAIDQSYIDKVLIGVDSMAQLENNLRSLDCQLPQKLVEDVLAIKIDRPDLLNPVNWNN